MKKIFGLLLLFCPSVLLAAPALTIYNNDFAVVRDTVPLNLKKGETEVAATGITARAEPKSVVLSDPSGKVDFNIVEQSYRADAVSVGALFDLFEGQEIEFLTTLGDKQELVKGKIIRSGYSRVGRGGEPIIEVDGKLRFGLPGQPLFPALGEDSVLEPTLNWTIASEKAAKFDARISYLTGGLSWAADYNVVMPEKGDEIELVGWVSFVNNSGKTFEEAQIKLLAGDVQKFAEDEPHVMALSAPRMGGRLESKAVTEKKLDEYHLYTIARPTTLRDQQTKQVEFLRSSKIKSKKMLIYNGTNHGYYGGRQIDPNFGNNGNSKIEIYREFDNSEVNGLGVPLPKGRLRFYRTDGEGEAASLEFVGEAEIDHTPKDETVRVRLGNAFDIVGERKQTEFKINESRIIGNNWIKESFEITLRNRGDEAEMITVVENFYRWSQWKIETASDVFTKTHADRAEANVEVAAGAEKKITYTVQYSW